MVEYTAVVSGIEQARAFRQQGSPCEALGVLMPLWEAVAEDGDQFAAFVVAQEVANLQGDPWERLRWLLEALCQADLVADDRVAAVYPALNVNIADAHLRCEDRAAARLHLHLARAQFGNLPDDGYGRRVRAGADAIEARLDGAPATRRDLFLLDHPRPAATVGRGTA